jgi:hypothetical protein
MNMFPSSSSFSSLFCSVSLIIPLMSLHDEETVGGTILSGDTQGCQY